MVITRFFLNESEMIMYFFFFSSRRRHTRSCLVSWARRCVQETEFKQLVFPDNPYQNPYLHFNSLRQANYILDIILQKGADVLYDKYLISQQPYYISEDIVHWHDAFMEQQYIKIDKGEPYFKEDNRWAPEKEPVPISIDNQSRCATRLEAASKNVSEIDHDKSSISQLSIRSSMAGSRTNLGGFYETKKSLLQMKSSEVKEEPKKEQFEPQLVFMESKQESGEPDLQSAKLREQRSKKDKEEMEKKQILAKQEQERINQEENRKIQANKYKHKQYTYDYNGEIICLKTQKLYADPGQQAQSGQTQQQTIDLIQLEYKNLMKIQSLITPSKYCLLYTSDAADDMQCVDLGGRRIIKKKKKIYQLYFKQIVKKYEYKIKRYYIIQFKGSIVI
eukprot:TRINITY_DN7623_c0_g1_i1.p1 TRINITY_DN7623_c0_g1~~TRINITY_DN7623_c0_g1_i1.p1  ORF type:complete len:391 (+),score=65.98 TRINITY_DN7623_c0_g1_i1:42-1214(+)